MRSKLQLSTQLIGDWFLFKDHTISRVYGFIGSPYILPTLMTSWLFALEYIRQSLFTEREQFSKARKGCNIKFHYSIGKFVIMSSLAMKIVEKILESLNFQEAQRINYDPKKIISNMKKLNRCGTFENQEIKGLEALANVEAVINKDYIVDERSRELESQGTVNLQGLNIQTPMKKTKVIRDPMMRQQEWRLILELQVKELKGILRIKKLWIQIFKIYNQEEIGKGVMIQQDDIDQEATSSNEQIVSHLVLKTHQSSNVVDTQSYQYTTDNATQFKSKIDLIQQYTKKRNLNLQENQKKKKEVRKASPNKLSLLTIKEPTKKVLNIALAEEEKVAEMKLRMDQISVPNKIHFHMKTSEVLYHDLLQSILSNKKLEGKVIKLEEQLQKKWPWEKLGKLKIKKMDSDLIEMGVKLNSQKSVNKLLEEKDKTISPS